jgi:hypothetical protein
MLGYRGFLEGNIVCESREFELGGERRSPNRAGSVGHVRAALCRANPAICHAENLGGGWGIWVYTSHVTKVIKACKP